MITSFNPQQSQMRQKQAFGTGFSREAIELGMAAADKVPGKSGYIPRLQEALARDGKNLRIHVEEFDTRRELLLQQVRIKGGLLEVQKSTVLAIDHKGKGILGNKNKRNAIGAVGHSLLQLTPESIIRFAKDLRKNSSSSLTSGHKYWVY